MKFSVITACYNSAATIRGAVESVLAQRGVEVESIVVDGGSTDGTVAILDDVAKSRAGAGFRFVSERDRGLYDAINKGIAMATGEIVGILNADDAMSDDRVLADYAAVFADPAVEAAYADIRFTANRVDADVRTLPTVRYCSARRFRKWMFRFAVMVPHPSFYCRRELFDRFGNYSLDYRICADFELVMRYLLIHGVKARYLDRCAVVMRMGGLSTAGFRSNVEINREDVRALRAHGILTWLPLVYFKYLFKIWGFVFHKICYNKDHL